MSISSGKFLETFLRTMSAIVDDTGEVIEGLGDGVLERNGSVCAVGADVHEDTEN